MGIMDPVKLGREPAERILRQMRDTNTEDQWRLRLTNDERYLAEAYEALTKELASTIEQLEHERSHVSVLQKRLHQVDHDWRTQIRKTASKLNEVDGILPVGVVPSPAHDPPTCIDFPDDFTDRLAEAERERDDERKNRDKNLINALHWQAEALNAQQKLAATIEREARLRETLADWDRIEQALRVSHGKIKLTGHGDGGLSVSSGDPQKPGYRWHRRDDVKSIAETLDWMFKDYISIDEENPNE